MPKTPKQIQRALEQQTPSCDRNNPNLLLEHVCPLTVRIVFVGKLPAVNEIIVQ